MGADRADSAAIDTVEAARAKMLATVTALPDETVGIDAALGRTLAESLKAPRSHPPFRSSAMDGYAVRSADLGRGPFTVFGEALAGKAFAGSVGASGAVRIFTGAPVPEGADLVIPQERARREGARVWLEPPAPLRANIRAAGVDFEAGDPLLEPGTRLNARHVALLAAAGIASLRARRAPRVAVLATGDELVRPGTRAQPDQIYDSVSFALAAMIAEWGGLPVGAAAARPDDAQAIGTAAERALADANLVVIIGGASVGDYDRVKPALARLGLTLIVPRIAIRPGKPTWFGTVQGKPVLGLAGNPAAAMVCAHLFLEPLLRGLLGRQVGEAGATALLEGELGPSGTHECYWRARVRTDPDARLRVRPFENQDTSLVSVFAASNALIRRPAGAAAASSGEPVEVRWLDCT